MLHWLRSRPVAVGIVVFLSCVFFQGYRILTLALDYRAVSGAMTSGGIFGLHSLMASWSVPMGYSVDLTKGLTLPDCGARFTDMRPLVAAADSSFGAFFAPDDEITAFLSQVADLDQVTQRLDERLSAAVASWPVSDPDPLYVGIGAPLPHYRLIRETGLFWCQLAWHLAHQGSARPALLAACGPAILSVHLECRETQIAGLMLGGKRIGSTLRRMSGETLRALAPVIRATKGELVEVLRWVAAIEQSSPAIGRAIANEKNLLPSLGHCIQQAIERGEAQSQFGRNPYALARVLQNQAMIDSCLDPILGEAIQASRKPYREAMERMKVIFGRKVDLADRVTAPGLHWAYYLLRPERYCIDLLSFATFSYLGAVYVEEIASWAKLWGGAAALMVHSFRREFGAWPDTAGDMEAWLDGWPLPLDPFTGSPLKYTPAVIIPPWLIADFPDMASSPYSQPSLKSPGPDVGSRNYDYLIFKDSALP